MTEERDEQLVVDCLIALIEEDGMDFFETESLSYRPYDVVNEFEVADYDGKRYRITVEGV